jgi:hypothetical protein
MSKDSIRNWSNGVNVGGVTNDELEEVEQGTGTGAKWDGSKEGWREYLGAIRTALLASSTKLRVNVLERELVQLVNKKGECYPPFLFEIDSLYIDLSMAQTSQVFELLTMTYPRYVDRPSRDAAEHLGVELLKVDERRNDKYGVAEHIISWIHTESNRICTKGAQRYSFFNILTAIVKRSSP